jgi:DNA-directed RNA polymerase subunit B
MASYNKLLIKKFFEENGFVKSTIESFNYFIEQELQIILEENREIEPTIIPPNVESFKIKLDKIWIGRPEITEADGSKRSLYPMEARLRKLSYAAPMFIEVSSHINNVQRETFTTQVGSIPIMLKSNYCYLHKLNRDDLIQKGEDPDGLGGYFLINGTERVLVHIEDLGANRFLVDRSNIGPVEYTGKIFSEYGPYKIPHTIEQMKDSIFYISFTRVKRTPLLLVLKSLGMMKDEEIMNAIFKNKQDDSVLINLFSFADIKNQEEALDKLGKTIGITQPKESRLERTQEMLDKYLLPHIGTDAKSRKEKAYNLCKYLKKYILVSKKEIKLDDKDHYMNKRIKLSGELLADLFRTNLKVLIGDMLYNFQRIVKRGKFPSIKAIIREKLLTNRIYGAMATGNWVGGRKGVSQRIQRLNFLNTTAHLQRVVSPLSSSQENFEARELHATHLGRLCPSETPEGTNIGLRKNLALLTMISGENKEEEIMPILKKIGLKEANQ